MADDRETRTVAVIESPMVGIFYDRPAPDEPPFVRVGAKVEPGMTLCIIEAMKVFTDIPAGGHGTILEILAKCEQGVEYGQPLFRVETDDPDAFGISAFEEYQKMIWDQITRGIGG
jgi:acetyl-CoA carboxylase biotin carboxyl carrier protein